MERCSTDTISPQVEDASLSAVSNAGANIHRFGPRFWATYGAPKVQFRVGGDLQGLFGPADCTETAGSASLPTGFRAYRRHVTVNLRSKIEESSPARSSMQICHSSSGSIRPSASAQTCGAPVAFGTPRSIRALARPFTPTKSRTCSLDGGLAPGRRPLRFHSLGLVTCRWRPASSMPTKSRAEFAFTYPTTSCLKRAATSTSIEIFASSTSSPIRRSPAGTPQNPIPAGALDDSADGKSYGLEVLLQRPFEIGVSTLVSYTLGFSDLTATGCVARRKHAVIRLHPVLRRSPRHERRARPGEPSLAS